MIKYTIGFKSNEKKAPILWEKYEFSQTFPIPWVLLYFLKCEIMMGKSMDFLYDDIGYFFFCENL